MECLMGNPMMPREAVTGGCSSTGCPPIAGCTPSILAAIRKGNLAQRRVPGYIDTGPTDGIEVGHGETARSSQIRHHRGEGSLRSHRGPGTCCRGPGAVGSWPRSILKTAEGIGRRFSQRSEGDEPPVDAARWRLMCYG